jgi:ABC-type multidrug transport system ATPase subunit
VRASSGAGKTTLMKMLKGEEHPDGGSLRLGDSVKLVSIEQVRTRMVSLDGL